MEEVYHYREGMTLGSAVARMPQKPRRPWSSVRRLGARSDQLGVGVKSGKDATAGAIQLR